MELTGARRVAVLTVIGLAGGLLGFGAATVYLIAQDRGWVKGGAA